MPVNNLGCDCCPDEMRIRRVLARHVAESVQTLRVFEALDKLEEVANSDAPLCKRTVEAIEVLREMEDKIEEMYKLDYL